MRLALPVRAERVLARASSARVRCSSASSLSSMAQPDAKAFKRVPADTLFVSEPPPDWFGNPPNESRNATWTNNNWLKSRFHFNFAEHTGGRPNYGVLRVCNDDLVQPARGFGTHPHANAEIATYIVDGSLTHADSMGTSDTLTRGGVQFMTAGRGVRHSERNASATAPLRFIQMWFTPRTSGLPPNYGSFAGDAAARRDAWAHLVGDVADTKRHPPVKFNADANVYATELSPGAVVAFPLAAGRQAYLLACEGDARVGGAHGYDAELATHDGAEVTGPSELRVTAGARGAHLLLVEMARAG